MIKLSESYEVDRKITKCDYIRYSPDANDIRLVNLGPIALFSNYKLTTSSGKHLEEISHAHIVSLMYKLLTSSKDSDDFDRSRGRRKNELSKNKNIITKKNNINKF